MTGVQTCALPIFDVSHLSYKSKEAYGGVPLGANPPFLWRTGQTQTMTGIYLQDQIKWQNWRVTAGGRYDWLNSKFEAGAAGAVPTESKSREGKFTGRAALSYVTDLGFVPYVSYGTSFVPNPGTVLGGSVAVPTTGEQVEAGVKYDLPGYNAALRAAVFSLKQENAVVYEVVNGLNRQVQLDLRSKGFEIEGVASMADGLSVQASYSYNDARILKLTPETVGNRLTSVPYHMASAWLDYTVQQGAAKGVGIGGGVRYVGSSLGDNLNRAVLDNKPRTFVDASIRYDLDEAKVLTDSIRLAYLDECFMPHAGRRSLRRRTQIPWQAGGRGLAAGGPVRLTRRHGPRPRHHDRHPARPGGLPPRADPARGSGGSAGRHR